MEEQVFTFRNRCEFLNLLNVFQHKVFSVSLVINEKKTTVMKSLSIYFGHHSLAFLNSFLNILNKYNILVLNKYNLEYVTCLFINLFLQYLRGRGPTRWRAKGRGSEGRGPMIRAKSRGSRNTNTRFLKQFEINIIPPHSDQSSCLPFELIDGFLYEAKIAFKLIKIQLCKTKISVMRVGSTTHATSKMEFFVAIIKKWNLLNTVPKSSILDVTADTKN